MNSKCENCGETNIVMGIPMGLTAEAGNVGPQYRVKFIIGTEALLVDICKDCGEVQRLYVKNPDRNWLRK